MDRGIFIKLYLLSYYIYIDSVYKKKKINLFATLFFQNFTIQYWTSQGADRRKLVMGMPMYGQSFSLASKDENELNAPTYGGGEAGEETRARGFLAYYEVTIEKVLLLVE